jgi:predicted RecA/RadA family phage recombinase
MTATASYSLPDNPSDGCNNTTGGSEATDMGACSEYRVLTGTGDTSNPALVDTTNDNASVYVALLEAAPPSGFPTVESETHQLFTSDTTTHNVVMPATVNSGDLLIVLFGNDLINNGITTPGGWTRLNTSNILNAYYKIADGTQDGASIDWVTVDAQTAVALIYRISGWHGTTPPEIDAFDAEGPSDSPNSPSVTASWGSADNLFISCFYFDVNATTSVSSIPTNYTNLIGGATGAAAEHASAFATRRNLAAATDDPGSYLMNVSDYWKAQTLVVRPAATAAVRRRAVVIE